MIMKIAIVDDDRSYIEQVKILCKDFETRTGEPAELTCFLGGSDFLDKFQPGIYQIVFMDIFMKGITGIDTARKLREIDHTCLLVFLTSSSDFMPDAFSFHAFDYITKPFSAKRIFQVLDDARKHFPKQKPSINIVSGRQTIPLLLSDIVSVVNDAHYLDIRTKDAAIGHEAKIGSISGDAVFYLMSRGMTEEDARALIVSGFADNVSKELPVEYAVEMNNLIRLEMKGSIG